MAPQQASKSTPDPQQQADMKNSSNLYFPNNNISENQGPEEEMGGNALAVKKELEYPQNSANE
jgi:hypothetical protein